MRVPSRPAAPTVTRVLNRIESYYDAVPRSSARAEDFGPLTFFVREGADGWPFYARPALGRPDGATAADVERVRARQRELGLPEAFEWVAETTPGLRAAVEASGLVVHEHPLMVLEGEPLAVPEPEGARVLALAADDPRLAAAVAAPYAAFGATPGPADVERVAARIGAGLTVLVAGFEETGGPGGSGGAALAGGQVQPVGDVAEVVGVGTRPEARRRGLGLAVTAALVAEARARGVGTVFLTASDAAVERLYARLGFRTVATALIAEAPAP
ncbi:GNAT family N-acetyltransferase [Streptomyces omiyaensis]|uniref:GNAT family N-acetyltransferase n=1 Tax=Streptomyces omiyaensis TaxID=68247 RepID=A0ABW7C2R9_9ACTN|nr:GNAT family N-acetyltransferase [Streptomyces omiyaensis]